MLSLMKNKNKYAQLVSTLLLFGIGSISCQSQTQQKFNDNKRTRICHDTMYYASKQQPDTLFEFSNGKTVGIWGYMEVEKQRKIFSEFILSECMTGRTLDSWDALDECELQFKNDTLYVKQLDLFAIGEDAAYEKIPWKISLFYCADGIIKRHDRFNRGLHLNETAIDAAIKEFELTQWKDQVGAGAEYAEEKFNLINRIMISAISGNEKSERYFKEFEEKFKPDGYYAEWYHEMKGILEYWKQP